MIDSAVLNASVNELHQMLTNRVVSSEELTRAFLARIERLNPQLNAVVTVCEELAIADAMRASR